MTNIPSHQRKQFRLSGYSLQIDWSQTYLQIRFLLCALCFLLPGPADIHAQTLMPGDPLEFYLRWVAEDHGQAADASQLIRPLGLSGQLNQLQLPEDHPWSEHPFLQSLQNPERKGGQSLMLFSPVLKSSLNTEFPFGMNDGPLWQGKGYNLSFSTGVGYKWKFVEAAFRPIITYSENRDFDLSHVSPYEGLSDYAMALTNADIPQRFGEDPINQFNLGESYIKFRYSGWNAGLSNQRVLHGPAVYNPLLFSYNAPGFLHAFVGTDEPFQALRGQFETRIFWGGLQESDYFDDDSSNNLRYITGFTLNYSPDFVKGFSMGFSRTAVSYFSDSGLEPLNLFMSFYRLQPKKDDLPPNDARFIKSSIFTRYHIPQSGIEAYVEWGRNDNRRVLRDVLTEPELNRGYVLGFIKRFNVGKKKRIVANIELTNLENSTVTSQYRDFNIWYTHPVIRQGFTNDGQVLGASIGPGSSNQMINLAYYEKRGMAGIYLGRQVHNNDRLYKNREFYHSTLPRPWMTIRYIHEVEMYYGMKLLLFLPKQFELQADYRFGKIENRHNLYDRKRNGDDVFYDVSNRHISLTLRYRFNRFFQQF